MSIDGLNERSDAKDGRRQHQGLLSADPVSERPCGEARNESAELLEPNREGTRRRRVGGIITIVGLEGIEGQDSSNAATDTHTHTSQHKCPFIALLMARRKPGADLGTDRSTYMPES